MTENYKSALTQELLNNQRKMSEDIDKLYKDVTQLIVEKEASLKTDLYLQKLSNQKLKQLTKNLDEIKHDTKKSDEIYIEHVRMLKETKLLEKLLGIHCTVSKIDENPYVVKTCVTFNEEQSVNFLFDIENGAFALDDMNPKHKNYENLQKYLAETQDIRGFIVNLQKYFKKLEDNKENQAMEVDNSK